MISYLMKKAMKIHKAKDAGFGKLNKIIDSVL